MVTDEIKVRDGRDFHKAVFGRRPPVNLDSAEAYDLAETEFQRRSATPAGRNALREDGWKLDGDPDWDYRE